jgi:hypothetical protein
MRAVRYQVWCSADEGRGDGVDGNDGVVASDSEGDDEVRLDETIRFTSFFSALLVPNSNGSWLNFFLSGEAPASLSGHFRSPVRGKKR